MKQFFLIILGFLLILLSYTLFASLGFWFQAALYAFCLYLLFFLQDVTPAFYLLAGITLGSELLGTAHFGLATILAWALVALYLIFRQHLHLTSRYIRYGVALLITLIFYNLLLFSWTTFFVRLGYLAALLPFLLIISYFTSSLKQVPDYESI